MLNSNLNIKKKKKIKFEAILFMKTEQHLFLNCTFVFWDHAAVDSSRLERRALCQDTGELLEGAAGEGEGDAVRVHSSGGAGGESPGAGSVAYGPGDDGSQPGREGENQGGVRGLGDSSRVPRLQVHVYLRQYVYHRVHQVEIAREMLYLLVSVMQFDEK